MRVLLSVRPSTDTSNPYVDLLERAIPEGTDVLRFSYRRALWGRYDVLHAQWPEYIFRGSTFLKALIKAGLGITLLARLKATRTPVVLTVHNIATHERAGRLERMQVALLERLTVSSIYLNEAHDNDVSSGVVILHGRYPNEGVFAERKFQGPVSFFGQVRPYKGIEALIAAATTLPEEAVMVAGMPVDDDYAAKIARLAEEAPNVDVDLRHLSEDELERRLRNSKLVVLPYHYMYNSGAAIMALGLSTPVLIPRSSSTETLADEVGGEWVTLFEPPLDRGDVVKALSVLDTVVIGSSPDLSRRDWRGIGQLHHRLYQIAAAHRTGSIARRRRQVRDAIEADSTFTAHSPRNIAL